MFGGDVHVVWEKFCRYFDVEPRIVPLQPGKYTIGPEDVAPHVDENTIGVAAVLGTTFTGPQGRHRRHQRPAACGSRASAASTCRCTSTAPAAGSSGRSSTPTRRGTSASSRCARSTSPGHKFGLVYPGIGWLIFRETADLAPDLVFEENYLGKTDATFTLNFSTGSAMVLAQYYNLVRYGRAGLHVHHAATCRRTRACSPTSSRRWAGSSSSAATRSSSRSSPSGSPADEGYDEFDIAWQLVRRARLDGPGIHAAARTPRTSRSCARWSRRPSAASTSTPSPATSRRPARRSPRRVGAHESERRKMVVGSGH